MRTLLLFLSRIEYILYALAGIGIFFSIRAVTQAQIARRNAVFGLEREAAQNRLTRAASTIVALLMMSGAVYIVANIITPNTIAQEAIVTPTLPIIFVSPQPTATESRLLYPTVTATPGLAPVAGATAPPPNTSGGACDIIGARIISPIPNQTVVGQVAVQGGANILNFAAYKFEIRGSSTGDSWAVVGTFTAPVIDPGFLGTWDSTSLSPGNYMLRLVVYRVDSTFPTPCEVPITIAPPGADIGPSPTVSP